MKRTLILSLLAATALLAGCGNAANDTDATTTPANASPAEVMATASPTAPSEAIIVDVRGFTYAPKVIEVPVGTTITWTNADQILHTVTSGTPDSPDGTIDGQMPEAGTTTSFTFDTPGTVTYFCSRHLFMLGEVIVR